MESPASLADIKEVLEILVGQGASLANLEMCLPLLGLRQVEERSPSGTQSDLAVTARRALVEEISGFGATDAKALMNLLALKPGTEDLRPGVRKKAASEETDWSYEEMRRTQWKVLISKLADRLYEGDYAIRSKEAQPVSIRSTIGLGTDSIRLSLSKVAADLDAISELSEDARTNLCLPQPIIVRKVEFSLGLSFFWSRLDKHHRSIEKQCLRAVHVSDDLQTALESMNGIRTLSPLSEPDRSLLRVIYKKKANRELYKFTKKLNSDAVRLAILDAAWTDWLSCAMSDNDECDCAYHSWTKHSRDIHELTNCGDLQASRQKQ